MRTALLAYGERLRDNGIRVVMESELKITEAGAADQKMIACALLGRSLSNYKGVAMMVREGLIIEARTLVRSIYENLFFLAKLERDGPAFVKQMKDDEIASRLKRSKFIMDSPALHSSLLDEVRQRLHTYDVKTRAENPKAKTLSPKQVAEGGALTSAYLAYSQLSGDSAHPSFSSLARHFSRVVENGETIPCFDIQPLADDATLDDTLKLGINALLGSIVATNQLLGGTPAGQELSALADDFIAITTPKKNAE